MSSQDLFVRITTPIFGCLFQRMNAENPFVPPALKYLADAVADFCMEMAYQTCFSVSIDSSGWHASSAEEDTPELLPASVLRSSVMSFPVERISQAPAMNPMSGYGIGLSVLFS